MATRRAVVYARTSKESARSVPEQLADCRTVISANKWESGPEFTDTQSASRYATVTERPGWRALLAELRPGDVLVIWESSRAGRRLEDYVALRDTCATLGVLLCAGGQVLDLTNPNDRLSAGIKSVVSEHETDQLAERVRRTKRLQAAEGHPPPRLGFGYRREFAPDGSFEWMLDPVTAPLVREFIDHLLDGGAISATARDWKTRGITAPTGRPWNPQTLRKLALRPSLAALRVHQGKTLGPGGRWPAIITPGEHYRLKALLADPGRRRNYGPTHALHLLTNIAACGVCDGMMIARGKKRAYACARGCVYRSEPETDAVVIPRVLKALQEWQADAFVFDVDEGGGVDVAAEREVLDVRLSEYRQRAVAGKISADSFAAIEQGILAELAGLEHLERGAVIDPLLELIAADPVGLWDGLSLDQQRRVVRLTVSVVIRPLHHKPRYRPADFLDITPILPDRRELGKALSAGQS